MHYFCRSCYPTVASDNSSPHARVNLRSDLCLAYGKDPLYDIEISAVKLCEDNTSFAHRVMCHGCQQCPRKQRLAPSEQSMYKYQLIVDGQAATNDASVWKLLSNSAVVRLRPDGWDVPIFEQFYDPILKPYVHFLPSDMSHLPLAIKWCEDHSQVCEQLGHAARQTMKCVLKRAVIEGYIFGVFVYMHDGLYS
jgi:hypothetical protein